MNKYQSDPIPGGRVIREVLRMIGYDRDTKRFLIEPVFEVQHAAV